MDETSPLLLAGVDGGGTGCRAAIADARGARRGLAHGGPANFTTDPALALRSVADALEAAAAEAGLGPGWRDRCTAHLGLAGVLSPGDAAAVAGAAGFARVRVTDDRATSLAGALGARDGVLAAIGTGTIVAGRIGGTTRFFGGWGHHLSDQASGGWLGRGALRRAMLAHDGLEEHTPLTRGLLARFGDDPRRAVAFAAEAGPGELAGLARAVVEAAAEGDATGCALMRAGAAYLERCIDAVGPGPGAVLCLAGGIGPHYAAFLAPAHRDRIRPPLGTALDGALRLAAEALADRRESA